VTERALNNAGTYLDTKAASLTTASSDNRREVAKEIAGWTGAWKAWGAVRNTVEQAGSAMLTSGVNTARLVVQAAQLDSTERLLSAAAHPVDTASGIGQAIAESYVDAYKTKGGVAGAVGQLVGDALTIRAAVPKSEPLVPHRVGEPYVAPGPTEEIAAARLGIALTARGKERPSGSK
jgi:hypothetical protein